MNRNSVAQLISRARINLRDGLRHGALVSIPAASAECETALPLLALAQDGELDDATSADWLARHLVGCATCRVRVEAMQEAGAAYRVWLPLVPVLWLRASDRQGGGAHVGDDSAARQPAAQARRARRRGLHAPVGSRAGRGRRRTRADAPAPAGDDGVHAAHAAAAGGRGPSRAPAHAEAEAEAQAGRAAAGRDHRRGARADARARGRAAAGADAHAEAEAARAESCRAACRDRDARRRDRARCRRRSRKCHPSLSIRRRRRLRPASRRGSRAPTARSWAVGRRRCREHLPLTCPA